MDESNKKVDERFPGNSYNSIKAKKAPSEDNGEKAVQKKKTKDMTPEKTMGERIADSFLEVDHKAIRESLIFDMLIPWLKDTAEDLLHMILYGGSSRGGRRRTEGSKRVPYNSMYNGDRKRDRDDDVDYDRQNFRRIRILIRDERRKYAEQIIRDLIEEQDDRGGGWITVKDLYSHEYVNLPTNYVQSNWGWKELYFDDVRFTRDSDGWIIEMPKAEVIGR